MSLTLHQSCTSEALIHFRVSQYTVLPTGKVSKQTTIHEVLEGCKQWISVNQTQNFIQGNNQLFMPLNTNYCFINY